MVRYNIQTRNRRVFKNGELVETNLSEEELHRQAEHERINRESRKAIAEARQKKAEEPSETESLDALSSDEQKQLLALLKKLK